LEGEVSVERGLFGLVVVLLFLVVLLKVELITGGVVVLEEALVEGGVILVEVELEEEERLVLGATLEFELETVGG
jgi:hypothetical protein